MAVEHSCIYLTYAGTRTEVVIRFLESSRQEACNERQKCCSWEGGGGWGVALSCNCPHPCICQMCILLTHLLKQIYNHNTKKYEDNVAVGF